MRLFIDILILIGGSVVDRWDTSTVASSWD